jgi:hypothetical protein
MSAGAVAAQERFPIIALVGSVGALDAVSTILPDGSSGSCPAGRPFRSAQPRTVRPSARGRSSWSRRAGICSSPRISASR